MISLKSIADLQVKKLKNLSNVAREQDKAIAILNSRGIDIQSDYAPRLPEHGNTSWLTSYIIRLS